jgi:hypothetical protein
MKPILMLFGWLLIIAIQVSLWPQITEGIQPAFTLAAALAVGLTAGKTVTGPARARVGSSGNLWTGFWLAVISGTVLGLYAQHHFGLLTVASALGYASIWLVIRPPVDDLRWPGRLSAALLAAAVYELVILLVLKLTVKNFPLLAELATVGTLNVLGTVAAFAVFVALFGAYRRRSA